MSDVLAQGLNNGFPFVTGIKDDFETGADTVYPVELAADEVARWWWRLKKLKRSAYRLEGLSLTWEFDGKTFTFEQTEPTEDHVPDYVFDPFYVRDPLTVEGSPTLTEVALLQADSEWFQGYEGPNELVLFEAMQGVGILSTAHFGGDLSSSDPGDDIFDLWWFIQSTPPYDSYGHISVFEKRTPAGATTQLPILNDPAAGLWYPRVEISCSAEFTSSAPASSLLGYTFVEDPELGTITHQYSAIIVANFNSLGQGSKVGVVTILGKTFDLYLEFSTFHMVKEEPFGSILLEEDVTPVVSGDFEIEFIADTWFTYGGKYDEDTGAEV